MRETYVKHAEELYGQAMEAEGQARRRLLREALNILANVPDDAEGRSALAARLEAALQEE